MADKIDDYESIPNWIDTLKKSDYDSLRKAYDQALVDEKEEFMWQGQEVLTAFAKYVMEYLGPKFKNMK